MTDRELLELAAKAAGLDLTWRPNVFSEGGGEWPAVSADDDTDSWTEWDPLTDDGDALRLAVKLRLVIQHAPKYVVVMDVDRRIAEHQDTRENDGDADAATRRAIVRAAAEIGRTK